MQNAEWIAMIRQIPQPMQCQLMLVLANRAEISVEVVCRLEPSYVAIRGRMGGTTESSLLFMIPYDQLSGLYLTKEIKEDEVQALFATPEAPDLEAVVAATETEEKSAAESRNQSTPVVPSFGRAPEATSVARNNLLERLRAARQAANPPPNGK